MSNVIFQCLYSCIYRQKKQEAAFLPFECLEKVVFASIGHLEVIVLNPHLGPTLAYGRVEALLRGEGLDDAAIVVGSIVKAALVHLECLRLPGIVSCSFCCWMCFLLCLFLKVLVLVGGLIGRVLAVKRSVCGGHVRSLVHDVRLRAVDIHVPVPVRRGSCFSSLSSLARSVSVALRSTRLVATEKSDLDSRHGRKFKM